MVALLIVQICDLEAHLVNLTLKAPGVYIGTQFHTGWIGSLISNIVQHLDLAIHLLCFRDQCISVTNQYDNHLSEARSFKSSFCQEIIEYDKIRLFLF